MAKQREIELFDSLRRDNPRFESGILKWEPGPDPPDFIGTRKDGTKVGVELTEWLDPRQASVSIRRTEVRYAFWKALNINASACPRNCSAVQVSLKEGVRLNKKHESKFCAEFFKLIAHLDKNWELLVAGSPLPTWTDFSGYPTVAKYVSGLTFLTHPLNRRNEKQWVIFEGTGGAYTPRWAAESLLTRIRTKTTRYRGISKTHGLSELVLVVHYGLKGILHNTPYQGTNFGLNDILREAASELRQNAGPFQRVYLYLAFNEGPLIEVWPNSEHKKND